MFATGGMLPWHQTQPGRKLAPTAEAARFYHRGGEGCGDDRADARNARQALADGVALVPGHELLLDRRNRRLQLLNLCRQSGSRASPSSRTMAISLPTLRKPCGAITPNSARCPRKAFTRPVRWRTSRSRPRCSSTAACWSAVLIGTKRIGGIVLVALDVRLHVSRWHQSHLVAKRAQLPPPVVRRRARLQANQTGRQSTEER